MSKRAHGSAFHAITPAGMLVTAHDGFDAPELQAPQSPPTSPTLLLQIPGQWPQSISYVPQTAPPTVAASIFSAIGKLVSSVTLTNIIRFPSHVYKRIFRNHVIRAVPINREDGSRKKRLVDAGHSAPVTPTKARDTPGRRNKQTSRLSSTTNRRSLFMPGMWPNSPILQPKFSATMQPSPLSSQASPLSTGDSPTGSDIDIAMIDDSLELSWSEDPDFHMSTSPEPSPRRFTYVGDDEAPAPHSVVPSPIQDTKSVDVGAKQLPDMQSSTVCGSPIRILDRPSIWPIYETLTPPAPRKSTNTPSSTRTHTVKSNSIKDNVAKSDATKHNTTKDDITEKNVKKNEVIDNDAAKDSAPKDNSAKDKAAPTASPIRNTSKLTNTHKLLLRTQFKNVYPQGVSSPPKVHADHTVPSPRPFKKLTLSTQQKDSIALKNSAMKVALLAGVASDQYKAAHEVQTNKNTVLGAENAPDDEPFVNTAFPRFLVPSSEDSDNKDGFENDLSTLPDAPSPPPPQKTVRFAEKNRTKFFYIDERVSDMHDSTLERIQSSPKTVSAALLVSAINETVRVQPTPSSPQQLQDDGSPVGFRGVPPETWEVSSDEDSLDESLLSIELIEDLQDKLAIAPKPAPPAPKVKPLVTPLTEEEQIRLDDIVKKTDSGRAPNVEPVPNKLSSHDLGTLLPGLFSGDPRAWLNDNVVNEYLAILVDYKKAEVGFKHKRDGPAPAVHAFSSFWFPNMQKDDAYKKVERWASKKQLGGKQFLDATLLLFPICDGGHWRLLAVKPQERTIEYLDSLGLDGSTYVNKMHEYLKLELKDFYAASEWRTVEKQRSTRQINGRDCGVFTVLNALALLRSEEPVRVIACDGMQDARKRIAITLSAGKPTTEMK